MTAERLLGGDSSSNGQRIPSVEERLTSPREQSVDVETNSDTNPTTKQVS